MLKLIQVRGGTLLAGYADALDLRMRLSLPHQCLQLDLWENRRSTY